MWTATAMATPPLPLTAAEATILRQITLTDVLTFKALDVARSLRPSLPPSLPVPPYILHRGNPYQDSCKRNFRPATGRRRRAPHTMYRVRRMLSKFQKELGNSLHPLSANNPREMILKLLKHKNEGVHKRTYRIRSNLQTE